MQNDKGIIDNFSDKVTQDVDQSEGRRVSPFGIHMFADDCAILQVPAYGPSKSRRRGMWLPRLLQPLTTYG